MRTIRCAVRCYSVGRRYRARQITRRMCGTGRAERAVSPLSCGPGTRLVPPRIHENQSWGHARPVKRAFGAGLGGRWKGTGRKDFLYKKVWSPEPYESPPARRARAPSLGVATLHATASIGRQVRRAATSPSVSTSLDS